MQAIMRCYNELLVCYQWAHVAALGGGGHDGWGIIVRGDDWANGLLR